MTTYKESGVDIEAGDAAIKKISTLVRKTFNNNTLIDLFWRSSCLEPNIFIKATFILSI